MNYGYHNQGPPPAYNATFDDDEPLFTSPPEERNASMRNPFYQPPFTSTFGAPPMGEPSEPSAHPDNKTAATQTAGTSSVTGAPVNMAGSSAMGGGLQRQSSGAYDASTASKTDHGFFNGAPHYTSTPSAFQQQTASQPGVPGAVPVGVQPGSPYVQTQSVPAAGTSMYP